MQKGNPLQEGRNIVSFESIYPVLEQTFQILGVSYRQQQLTNQVKLWEKQKYALWLNLEQRKQQTIF